MSEHHSLSIFRPRLVLSALTTFAISSALQQAASEGFEPLTPVRRVNHTQDNAPPDVRLRIFLDRFAPDDGDHDLPLAKHDLSEAGFPHEGHDELIGYFRDLKGRVEVEIDRETWQMACNDEVARLDGVKIRAVLNALTDLQVGIYQKYLAVASAELARLGYVDFPDKLQQMKMSFAIVTLDYRDSEFISDERLTKSREATCKYLDGREYTAPK